MSSAKGHITGALIFIFGFIFLLSSYIQKPALHEMVLYAVLAVLFALWPDVDIKSVGQKIFYFLFFCMDLFLILLNEYKIAAYFGLIIILPVLAKHRGWTHTRPAMILIPLPVFIVPMVLKGEVTLVGLPYYAAAVTGYFSHLLLDGTLFRK